MNKIILFGFCILLINIKAQDIQIDFPSFKGKSYDFIIFQGSKTKVITQDVIPQDGKIKLTIPKEYAPYTGMSRWLITGTQEGGGLDMVIPGHDFSVTCKAAIPTEDNIIYEGNKEISELTSIYKRQEKILAKSEAMLMSKNAFGEKDKNYLFFEKEYKNQAKDYEDLQREIMLKNNYSAQFINIVNITRGIGTKILPTEKEKADNVVNYIVQDLDWEMLYTSGHWGGVITSLVDIQTQIFNNPKNFASNFDIISKKIKNSQHYTDFVESVTRALSQNGKDNFIAEITPQVLSSKKIKSYDGVLSVYIMGTEGQQASELIIENDKKIVFTEKEYNKTLLLFYRSDCGACEQVLKELPENYNKLVSAGIRVVSVSADLNESEFKDKSKNFPWKNSHCDYKGVQGENFKNYGVVGTPTLFLIDNSGKIVLRTVSLEKVLNFTK